MLRQLPPVSHIKPSSRIWRSPMFLTFIRQPPKIRCKKPSRRARGRLRLHRRCRCMGRPRSSRSTGDTGDTLPETKSSPLKIGPPWKRRFLLETTIFRGALLVLGSVITRCSKTNLFCFLVNFFFLQPFIDLRFYCLDQLFSKVQKERPAAHLLRAFISRVSLTSQCLVFSSSSSQTPSPPQIA